MRATFMLGAGLGLALLGGWGHGQNLFDVDKAPPARAFIRWLPPHAAEELVPKPGPQAPPRAAPLSLPEPQGALPEMARVLAGGVELTRAQVAALRRSPGPEAKKGKDPAAPQPVAMILLASKTGAVERVELLRGPLGEYLARRGVGAGGGDGKLRQLKADLLAPLAFGPGDWCGWAGGWEKPALAPGVARDVPREMLRPAWVRLDERTIVDRGLRAPRMLVQPAACELGDATVRLRPPRGYDPRKPAGLLVWIDPSPSGAPPDVLTAACDELGLAVVGVSKSGNQCGTGDRTQRALDALATAQAILHIDRSRVYATGLSGGGRMSGIVAGCFPDVFTGAVSMAGVAHFQDKLNELGKVWPAYFLPPRGERLELYKAHRLAATTGPKDFNHEQTLVLMEMQKEAGLDARVFLFDELGHQTPDSAGFADALRWVDEPARTAAAARAELGAKMLREFEAKHADGAVTPDTRILLLAIMDKAPWTPAAWTAAEKLGLAPSK